MRFCLRTWSGKLCSTLLWACTWIYDSKHWTLYIVLTDFCAAVSILCSHQLRSKCWPPWDAAARWWLHLLHLWHSPACRCGQCLQWYPGDVQWFANSGYIPTNKFTYVHRLGSTPQSLRVAQGFTQGMKSEKRRIRWSQACKTQLSGRSLMRMRMQCSTLQLKGM